MVADAAARYASLMSKPLIVLASASPRRSELLRQIGIPHLVRPVDVDERRLVDEAPADYVQRVASAKADRLWAGAGVHTDLPVLGSDTTVALDGDTFGKPGDRDDAHRMLGRLSGRTHEVHTAVALRHGDRIESRLSVSEVSFREISRHEIDAYWDSGEPGGKAGAYAIQGLAALFISRISGSYSGIMGLPLYETAQLLDRFGISSLGLAAARPSP